LPARGPLASGYGLILPCHSIAQYKFLNILLNQLFFNGKLVDDYKIIN